MLNLIRNELMKIFRRPGTYVMIALVIAIVSVAGMVIKYQGGQSNAAATENWQEVVQQNVEESEKQLQELEAAPATMISSIERDIAINEYRIEHGISPFQEYSVLEFINEASGMIQFVGLFVIIIAAGIVASEFNWGTIKLLLVKPVSRSKILFAKYITVLLFALFMLAVTFLYSTMLGAVLFGLPEASVPYLNYYNGTITEQNMFLHLVIFYGLKSISMLMLATVAFMISAVFRNNSLAIGLSIFLLLTGGQLTAMLASRFDWAKYSLFANTELAQYFEGVPLVEGMTLSFSIGMLVIYFVLLQVTAHYVFKKRDITA